MSLLAFYWCPEELGIQVMLEELQEWLSSYEGVMPSRQQERLKRSFC